jgi:hypothetical protein
VIERNDDAVFTTLLRRVGTVETKQLQRPDLTADPVLDVEREHGPDDHRKLVSQGLSVSRDGRGGSQVFEDGSRSRVRAPAPQARSRRACDGAPLLAPLREVFLRGAVEPVDRELPLHVAAEEDREPPACRGPTGGIVDEAEERLRERRVSEMAEPAEELGPVAVSRAQDEGLVLELACTRQRRERADAAPREGVLVGISDVA